MKKPMPKIIANVRPMKPFAKAVNTEKDAVFPEKKKKKGTSSIGQFKNIRTEADDMGGSYC